MRRVELCMGFFGSSVGCLIGLLIFLWQITLLVSAGPPPAHKLLAVRAALPSGCIFLLSTSPLGHFFPVFVAFLIHSLPQSPLLKSHTSSVSYDMSA